MTDTDTATDVQADAPTLTAIDRCDTGRCGAQARVRVVTATGPLDFCKHHYEGNEAVLVSVALAIHDEREFIR